jgi:hypothetical protein
MRFWRLFTNIESRHQYPPVIRMTFESSVAVSPFSFEDIKPSDFLLRIRGKSCGLKYNSRTHALKGRFVVAGLDDTRSAIKIAQKRFKWCRHVKKPPACPEEGYGSRFED